MTPVSNSKARWLLSFTGLIPVAVTLPLLAFHWWAIATVLTLLSAIFVIIYHLRKGQGVTSLDLFSFTFGLLNVILYFGFHTTVLFGYLDTIIYAMLLGEVVYAEMRGEPWTIQYAKRSIPPKYWGTTAFREANRLVSFLWGGCFLACLVLSLAGGSGVWPVLLPALLLIGTAILTPRLSIWYANRWRSETLTEDDP